MDFDEVLQKLFRRNSQNVFEETSKVLCKIADNILKDPSNLKFRTLQKSNATVSKKILSVTGALECLTLMGFEEQKTNYVLPPNSSLVNLEKFRNSFMKWRSLQDNKQLNTMEAKSETTSNPTSNKSEAIIKRIELPPLVLTYSNPFLRRVETYFHNMLRYENKELQRRALKLVPLARLEENAQKSLRNIQEHIKKNKLEDPNISVQETLILELLNWFKLEFFSWVDSPECSYCGSKTVSSHMSTDPDLLVYTDRVELHRCATCHKFTPFPRYEDLNILLETRRGRCGEWANTFTLFCRAMGWDCRFVVDEGDHVWTEVYSVTQKRWLHCDPCENICDTPLVYETGWNKQISYVMAYSADEVQDVTWRYSSNHKDVLKRRKNCSETELLNALFQLRAKRQQNVSDAKKKYLNKRLLNELVEFLTEKKPNEKDKHGRSSGSAPWRLARGEIHEVKDPLYVWQIREEDIADNNVTITYSTALDKYQFVSAGIVLKEVDTWSKGVYKCSGIFRKEEEDWKMVYLTRRETEEHGNISWRIELVNCSKQIDTVSLNFQHTTYENGIVKIQMCSGDKCLLLKNEIENIKDFSGSQVLSISATLAGGKGDISWQHAQLFRQSSDSEEFPFILSINFK